MCCGLGCDSIWVQSGAHQTLPWFEFYFPLFWGMIMCDNEFKTKGNKNLNQG